MHEIMLFFLIPGGTPPAFTFATCGLSPPPLRPVLAPPLKCLPVYTYMSLARGVVLSGKAMSSPIPETGGHSPAVPEAVPKTKTTLGGPVNREITRDRYCVQYASAKLVRSINIT